MHYICVTHSASCSSTLSPTNTSPTMAGFKWLRPEVYPLFAAVGAVISFSITQLVRNIYTNPEVRVNKEHRAAGVLENHAEGEAYAEHRVRKFLRKRPPQIMPSINKIFSDRE